MRKLALLACLCASAWAQSSDVAISEEPSRTGVTTLNFYDGSNNLIYSCRALSIQAPRPGPNFSKSATTLTNIAVSTNVGTVTTSPAHGLQVGNPVVVAGSATAALNGRYLIQTVGSTTTFTITTSGVGDATYTDAALTITTSAPQSTNAVWAIQKRTYVASQLTVTQWGSGSPSAINICDNRATIAYQ